MIRCILLLPYKQYLKRKMPYGEQYISFFSYLQQISTTKFMPGVFRAVIQHILTILVFTFSRVYRGKIVDFACSSSCRRTTIAHFLNSGKWNVIKLENIFKETVASTSYGESPTQASLCSVLWMIRSFRRQSLHHGLCTLPGMRISTNPR